MGTRPPDAYSPYEHGVRQLLNQLGTHHVCYDEVQTYQQRLVENINLSRRYGDSETRRADRAALLEWLNGLALNTLNTTFERLCSSVDVSLALQNMPLSEATRTRNPFGHTGRITNPDDFFNRETLLNQIFDALSQGDNLSLVGEPQVGKSSLLAMICALGPQRITLPPDTFAYINVQRAENEDAFYELLCEKLGIESSRGTTLMRAVRNTHHVLCLDELEGLPWGGLSQQTRHMLATLAHAVEPPLHLVIASTRPLDELFPDDPPDTSLATLCRQFHIERFGQETARAFLARCLNGTGVVFANEDIEVLLHESEGNPGRLQQAAATMYRQVTLRQRASTDA